jgi:hypothetical protein
MTGEDEVREVADRLALVIGGVRTEIAWQAAQDLWTAIIAMSADTPAEAAELADAAAVDLIESVKKNWRWYRDQVVNAQPEGRA